MLVMCLNFALPPGVITRMSRFPDWHEHEANKSDRGTITELPQSRIFSINHSIVPKLVPGTRSLDAIQKSAKMGCGGGSLTYKYESSNN